MEEAITALLASVADGRRHWGRAPQDISISTGPFIVLTRIDGVRSYTTIGAANYVASRVQMDVYGLTYTATKEAAREAIAAVSGHSGGSIQGIFIESERDLPAADAGEVTHLFRTSVDMIVHHEES